MYDASTADDLDFHLSMIQDTLRMEGFLQAVLSVVRPGDVVADLGCGTGILSLFACMAGAKHVYAIEQGPVIELARTICAENGYAERVTFVRGWSEAINLPQRVDVLLTETIGNLGLDEGIGGWVEDVRSRLLRDGGRVVPAAVRTILAPVEAGRAYDNVDGWEGDLFTFRFGAARRAAAGTVWWTELMPDDLLAEPAVLFDIDLQNRPQSDGRAETCFEIGRDGVVHGLGVWFSADLAPGVTISSAPPNALSSWRHGFLPLDRPLAVRAGERLFAAVSVSENGRRWQWHVDAEPGS